MTADLSPPIKKTLVSNDPAQADQWLANKARVYEQSRQRNCSFVDIPAFDDGEAGRRERGTASKLSPFSVYSASGAFAARDLRAGFSVLGSTFVPALRPSPIDLAIARRASE